MATPIATGSIIDEGGLSAVSWGAVLAGGVAAAAVSLVLLAFGIGVGFSVVSPWTDQGVSSTTFSVGAGVFLIVVAMLSSTVGGYLAGRLRVRWAGVHQDEVYFRDTAHGLLSWAFATVLSATVLGGAVTHILAGASAGSIPAGAAAATNSVGSGPTDVYVDRLLRGANWCTTGQQRRCSGNTCRADADTRPRAAEGRRRFSRRSRLCRKGGGRANRSEPGGCRKAGERYHRRGEEGRRRCPQSRSQAFAVAGGIDVGGRAGLDPGCYGRRPASRLGLVRSRLASRPIRGRARAALVHVI